jgi:hypothetical protein
VKTGASDIWASYDPFGFIGSGRAQPEVDPFVAAKKPAVSTPKPSLSSISMGDWWRQALQPEKSSANGDNRPNAGDESTNSSRGINFQPAKSTQKAEQHAAGLGTRANYQGDLQIANRINEHLTDLKGRGVPMPPKVEISRSTHAAHAAEYIPGTHTIAINPDSEFWLNPSKFALRMGLDNGWSTGNRLHVVTHEIGHWLHHMTFPGTFHSLNAVKLTPEQVGIIKDEVSERAATDPHEFVAEVYAGMVHGKTYSRQIRDWYNEFGGPTK